MFRIINCLGTGRPNNQAQSFQIFHLALYYLLPDSSTLPNNVFLFSNLSPVGKSSAMRQSRALKPIVEAAPKRQETTRFVVWDLTM